MVTKARIHPMNNFPYKEGPVIYWMQRDQRVNDNWALLFAQEKAIELKQPLIVVFSLVNDFLGATERHYGFMLKGLKEVSLNLEKHSIAFYILKGDPAAVITQLIESVHASVLVTDFNPLRLTMKWKKEVNNKLTIPFFEADAHNIIPCRFVSDKQEFGARTIRNKIQKLLPDFLIPLPGMIHHPFQFEIENAYLKKTTDNVLFTKNESDLRFGNGGEEEALRKLGYFRNEKLEAYHHSRNFPEMDGQSNLSPYLHFGQLSAQRVALDIRSAEAPAEAKNAFLEELIIRKELADNFCLYNHDYDHFNGFPSWSKRSLDLHRNDPRNYYYELAAFENGETHDELWNAAQKEMVITGKMHGYMRMYWAKKILEWTGSPEEAQSIAIYLNDKYELDGRDPNGYAGIAWSIGGTHDRPWQERPIFGMVRYMNYQGCARKFNVKEYIRKINAL